MGRLSIRIPDDLRSKIEARAAEAGHPSVEHYVESLVRADVGRTDVGGPEHLAAGTDAEVESLLLRRLENTEPGIEATPQFWARLRDEAKARRAAGAGR